MGRRVLRRVLKRGSEKGLSRRHLEGRTTPFREYDPLGVVTGEHCTGSPNKSIDQIGKKCPKNARKLCSRSLRTIFGDTFRTFCESRHPRNAFHDIMVASCHHGSSSRKEKRVSISNHHHHHHHHHHHRLTTMTTTTCDSDHEDQDDIMRGDDSPPHLSHPGTENPENPDEFHMVAEHSPPADHQPPQEGAMTIHPSSPAASSSLGYSASQYSISFLPLQHLEHPDPHELPDELWTSPSSSSGGGPPEASDEKLDRLYESHPRLHQEPGEATDHQSTQPSSGVIDPALSGMPSGSTSRQTPPTMTIRPIGAPLSSGASSFAGTQPYIGAQLAIGAPLSIPTTKSRGRTSQTSSLSSSQLCPGQQPLSSTSSSSLTTTPSTSSAIARPLHHETYLQPGGAQHPQPMEIDSPMSIERASPSSFISWQDSSSTEPHHLARYPGFWSQDGYQGFWGHPPPMPIQPHREHPYGDRIVQHQQQPPRRDRHQTSHQQPYQRPSLETIREEHQPLPHRERGQQQHSHRSWHRGEHQQDQRWQHQDTWHGWYYHPRQPQSSDSDLASQRPIGAGREWDSYILQRQQHQLSLERESSSSRTSASTWASQQDGGHRTRIHLNVFHLEASGMLRLGHLRQPR